MKIFGREPALWVAVVVSGLMLVATLGFDWLSAGQAVACGGFLVALVTAFTTRPVAPGFFTGAVTAAVGLLATYGLDLPDSTVAALGSFTLVLFALVTRSQVSPLATPLTHASNNPIR